MTGQHDTKRRETCSLCREYESKAGLKWNWCKFLKKDRAIDEWCKHFHAKGK